MNFFSFSQWAILFATENTDPSSWITLYRTSSMQLGNGMDNMGVRVRKQAVSSDVSHYSSVSQTFGSRTHFGFEK
jgi:hypothetical protein